MTLQEYIERDAKQFEEETGIPFRTAFKQRRGLVSHVVVPADLRTEHLPESLQTD